MTWLAVTPDGARALRCVALCLIGLVANVKSVRADETSDVAAQSSAGVTNPPIRQVAPGIFQIGMVQVDQSKGTVAIPAVVNLREGPIEYLLVTEYGKIHESLLRTEAAPYHLQVALLLLGQTASPRAIEAGGLKAPGSADRDPGGRGSGRLTIDIAWKEKGRSRVRRAAAGDYVLDRRLRKKVGPGHWLFVGSRFRGDGFAAQMDGSMITMIDDLDAIVANARPGNDDDDNWLATGRKLPPLDTAVELIITVERPRNSPKASSGRRLRDGD